MKKGNCYENACKYILDVDTESDLVLVHAIVTGTGGDVVGVDYGHAFLIERSKVSVPYHESPHGELKYMDIVQEHVIDVAKDIDNPTIVPLAFYRQIGDVRNEIRYTREEARKMVLEFYHWGPWDEVHDDVNRRAQESIK